MTEDEIIKGLQEGTIGTVAHLYLMCHDLKGRDTKGRDTKSRQKALNSAYDQIVKRCPGLITQQSSIVVSTADNNHFISMHIRFVYSADVSPFQAECYRILKERSFE